MKYTGLPLSGKVKTIHRNSFGRKCFTLRRKGRGGKT